MKKMFYPALSGFICLLLFGIPLFSYSGGGPGSKKAPAPPCTVITTKTINLYLSFQSGFVNGCVAPESAFSSYLIFGGATTLSNTSTYYCKITVTPNVRSGCTSNPVVSYWTTAGISKQISIPKNVQSRVTVEYYERCVGDCVTGVPGRRYFKYETTLIGTEPFVNAPVTYVSSVPC